MPAPARGCASRAPAPRRARITADGLSIVLSATPASGDQFLIQPTAQAAGLVRRALDQSVADRRRRRRPDVGLRQQHRQRHHRQRHRDQRGESEFARQRPPFSSPARPPIRSTAPAASPTRRGAISRSNGWQVQISGRPATGDTFTVQSNAGNTGDNPTPSRAPINRAWACCPTAPISINGATSALVTAVGSQAQQVNTAQTAQAAVNSQAQANVQSVSGVDLNEEAAKLVQWQQAYQASAQALPDRQSACSPRSWIRSTARTRLGGSTDHARHPKPGADPVLGAMDALESNISTDAKPDLLGPSVHDAGAESGRRRARSDNYNQVLAQSQQYTANANCGTDRASTPRTRR